MKEHLVERPVLAEGKRMQRTVVFVLCTAALIAAAVLVWRYVGADGEPGRADADDASLVARGAQVYKEQCASCHGDKLQGQPNWRQRLPDGRLPAPPHDASGHTWHHPDRQLFDIVKHGTAAFAPADYKTDMGAYKEILSDRDIWAALAYIKSRWPAPIRARQDGIDMRSRAQSR